MKELDSLEKPILNDWSLGSFDQKLSEEDIEKYAEKCKDLKSGLDNSNMIPSVLCAKILRNLYNVLNKDDNDVNNCRNFNTWLASIKKKYIYTSDEIQSHFNLMELNREKLYKSHNCTFDWLYNEHEIDDIIKLYNFNEHIKSIKEKINSIINEKYSAFCKYVYDCIKTYKRLNETYCKENENNTSSTLCDELKNFPSNYRTYILQLDKLRDKKFPALESYTSDNETNCLTEEYIFHIHSSLLKKYGRVGSNKQPIAGQSVKNNVAGSTNKYGFFDDLAVYQTNEAKSLNVSDMKWITSACTNVDWQEEKHKAKATDLCERFIKYYYFLSLNMGYNMPNESKYVEYLNFWLKNKITLEKDENFTTFFYKSLEKIFDKFHLKDALLDKVHNIDSTLFNNMKILYDLYYNYNKIENEKIQSTGEVKPKCEEYVDNCKKSYLKGIGKYQESRDNDFYLALKEFDALYRNVQYRSASCRGVILAPLPELRKLEANPQKKTVQAPSKMCTLEENYTTDGDTTGNDKYENISKNLSFYEYYNTLNNSNNLNGYTDEYCSKVERLKDKYPWICKLCRLFSKNLIDISKLEDEQKRKEKCFYFQYWIYDQIRKKLSGKNNYEPDVVLTLLDVALNINFNLRNNHCTMIYDSSISMEGWKEMKELHDYFEGYDNIKSYRPSDGDGEKLLCEYLTHINELYEKHIKESCVCIRKPNFFCLEKFPHYFKCDKKYYPNALLSSFKCNMEETSQSVESLFKSVTIDNESLTKSITSPEACTGLLCDPFYVFNLLAFGVLGLFSTFFVFYKFTPLGSRFQRKSLKKKQFLYAVQERDRHHSLAEDSERAYGNPSRRRLQLAYQAE
ncbi:PIR protein [Plasmodium vivax]|nr:PIR protein [Plasmodium vivax]